MKNRLSDARICPLTVFSLSLGSTRGGRDQKRPQGRFVSMPMRLRDHGRAVMPERLKKARGYAKLKPVSADDMVIPTKPPAGVMTCRRLFLQEKVPSILEGTARVMNPCLVGCRSAAGLYHPNICTISVPRMLPAMLMSSATMISANDMEIPPSLARLA